MCRRPVGVRQPAARVPLALLGDRPRRPGKGATTRAAAFPAAGTEPARTGWVVGLQTQVLRRHRSNCVTGAVDVSHARTPVDVQEQPRHVAPLGRMRPKRARRATQLLPAHHAPSANGPLFVRDRSQVCAGLSPARGAFPHPFAVFLPSGGGGNRTRVRGRTGQSVYKLRLPLRFARRPVGSRPTSGLAILWSRASGDWLSLGAEPVSDAATRATGRARSDALRYGLGSESECVCVLRTCVVSRLF